MNYKDYLKQEINKLKENNLYRNPHVFSGKHSEYSEICGQNILQFSSNNYLGLSNDERLVQASINAAKKYGIGSTGSRLISGTHKLHTELEKKLAKLKNTEAAIVFSTGYATNLGAISGLFSKEDAVYSDELNHASIIDGIKLSGATKFIYNHSDTQHLEKLLKENHQKHRFNVIITDTVFSMDGDIAYLKEIVALKEKYNAVLYIDEAHAFGVYGKKGQGLAHHLGLEGQIDIQMGTLSKAAGSEGGYICGNTEIIEYLRNKARSFVFSTAPSLPATAASIEAINIIEKDTALRNKLWENIKYLKTGINSLNIKVFPSQSAIFCVDYGSLEKNLQVSTELLEKYQILASCIRPPTVKTSRIRLCTTALHTQKQLDFLLEKLKYFI